MINLLLIGFIKFNLKIISFFVIPVYNLLSSIPGISSILSIATNLILRAVKYFYIIKELFLIPNSLILLFVSGVLFLIGLYQLMWFYSMQTKIIGFIRGK